MVKTGPTHIVNIIEPIQEKYNKYWSKMDFEAINIVFDSWCKLELIDFLILHKLGAFQDRECVEEIKTTLYTWFDKVTKSQKKKGKGFQ